MQTDMFADRPRKTPPERQRSIVMKRLRELVKWLAEPVPVAPKEHADDWYAGSCVEPARFTEQLVRLQNSLAKAGEDNVLNVPVRER